MAKHVYLLLLNSCLSSSGTILSRDRHKSIFLHPLAFQSFALGRKYFNTSIRFLSCPKIVSTLSIPSNMNIFFRFLCDSAKSFSRPAILLNGVLLSAASVYSQTYHGLLQSQISSHSSCPYHRMLISMPSKDTSKTFGSLSGFAAYTPTDTSASLSTSPHQVTSRKGILCVFSSSR